MIESQGFIRRNPTTEPPSTRTGCSWLPVSLGLRGYYVASHTLNNNRFEYVRLVSSFLKWLAVIWLRFVISLKRSILLIV